MQKTNILQARLNMQIEKSMTALKAAGPDNAEKQEVEIDPDFALHYRYIIEAISACSGKMVDGQMIRFVQRIKFAPIREAN